MINLWLVDPELVFKGTQNTWAKSSALGHCKGDCFFLRMFLGVKGTDGHSLGHHF